MDIWTSLPSSDTSNISQVSLPLAVLPWLLAQVWRVVSRIYFLLGGRSSSDPWIERVTMRAFVSSSESFKESRFVTVTVETQDCFKTLANSTQLHS